MVRVSKQGRIYVQTRQGLRPAYCPTCLGLGEVQG